MSEKDIFSLLSIVFFFSFLVYALRGLRRCRRIEKTLREADFVSAVRASGPGSTIQIPRGMSMKDAARIMNDRGHKSHPNCPLCGAPTQP